MAIFEDTDTLGGHHVTMKVKIRTKDCQRFLTNDQKLGGGTEGFSYWFLRKRGPIDTLILDFYPTSE